ncbi:MAG: hypothetical protein Q8R83_09965 [Legionellaceae bacterium]|nr:hypothetical protein [Legionellaceae bacterium]
MIMNNLTSLIKTIADFIEQDEDIDPECYAHFIQDPQISIQVIDFINELDESHIEKNPSSYTACIYVLDVCVSQLQSASENQNKQADKLLNQLMSHLAKTIQNETHTLSFWLPILNAFYEVHVELSDELKNAYLLLANDESDITFDNEHTHLNSIRELILELSDLSVFDIAENFFAQSYAMPPDFFIDLILDLYSIEEGQDIALLALLHPKIEVREVVVETLESLMSTITLSSISLSRLQKIKLWYPANYHDQFDNWIKIQRKKEVVFHRETTHANIIKLKASEIDGGGAQGIFIHLRENRKNKLCGLLFKQTLGIKDAWITPVISAANVRHYYDDTFDDSLVLRDMDLSYLNVMTNHFLACMLEQGDMPNLHLLEIQEELGLQFFPQKINPDDVLQQLSVQINPFTSDAVEASLKRSKNWSHKKRFAESWFIENASVDKLVNQCSSFVNGVKVCKLDTAIDVIFKDEMELHRDQWLFHFLWVSLWLKSRPRPNEKTWQDSFMIAYAIHSGRPLSSIPLLQELCRQSVLNSIETMQERKTYLSV